MVQPTDGDAAGGLFIPDKYFSRITDIDIKADLLDVGLTHVLLDIDNTIRSRATHTIPRDVGVWMGHARDAGIGFCLLSNNWHSSVYSFAGELDIPIVAKAMKPLPHGFALARKKIGGTRKDSVVIGDQLMTDVLGAHMSGIAAYLVLPLAQVDLKHTLFLRNIERILLGELRPQGAPANCRNVQTGRD